MRFLWTVETIKYSNRPFARGIVLASRQYKSELARTQKPCQLFNSAGQKISFQTPHKRNFKVFVPSGELQAGQTLTWLIWDTTSKKTFERVLKIAEVSDHHVVYDLESEQERVFQKRRFKRRPWNMAVEHSAFFEFENPFLSDSMLQGLKYRQNPEAYTVNETLQAPEVLLFNGKQYRRKTNFCFIFAPGDKKKTGSLFKKVMPESIELEFFRYDFELYDLLTGRKAVDDLPTIRKAHFSETFNVSPMWKEA